MAHRPLLPAVLACWLAAPSPAGAWVGIDGDTSAPHAVWTSLPVSYMLNYDGSEDLGGFDPTETVVLSSFAAWSDPECTDWATSYEGGTSRRPGSDGYNVLGWSETGWSYDSYAIGVASVSFWSADTIGEADIDFNGEYFTWSTSGGSGSTVDAQSIATHEMGHFLGLGDLYGSDCSGAPTMCGSYSGGTGPRTLAADDIEGLCTLYPSGTGGCTTDADCPTGHHCEAGICVPDVTAGKLCDPCSTHEQCGTDDDYCLTGFPDGGSYCGQECTLASDCPAGFSCEELGGTTVVRQCVPEDLDCTEPEPDCTTDADCPPGYVCDAGECVPDPATGCTTDADCPPGYVCNAGECIPDPTPECVTDADCPSGFVCRDGECEADTSPHLPMCAPCSSHNECGGPQDLCMGGFVDGSSRCGVACESVGGDCGEGNVCFEFPDLPDQCVPASMDCTPECTSHEDCPAGQHCEAGRCTSFCEPGAESCPPGWYCRFTSCTTGVCEPAPDGPGPGGEGSPCSSDLDCASLWCREMVDGSYCTVPCDFLSGGICPSPMTCQPAEGGMCGYCSCSAGRLGDSCEADGQCQAGTCGEEYGLNACVQDCTDPGLGCPAGFACIPVPDGSRSVCLPGKASMGQSCTQDSDCFDGQCIAHGGTMACTRRCDRLGCTCPQGFDCVDTAGSFAVCAASGEVTSGCGCSVPGARSGTPWPVALLGALITLAILLGRDRPRLPRATRSPPGTADPRNHP